MPTHRPHPSPIAWPALLAVLVLPATVRADTRDPIIVDDQHGEPSFTITGDDWTTWGTNGYGYDGGDTSYHYLSHTIGGADRRGTATWSPTLPDAGTYRIETWFRRTENRTADADHFVHDGSGGETHLVIDQTGDGASGWLELGEFYCLDGFGGCTVVLDGTDDDYSDEANAMRFTQLDSDPPPPPPECDEEFPLGTHELTWWAGDTSASDWEDAGLAGGEPDGAEAHSSNVDAGEFLRAGGWEVCDPAGEETLDRIEIEVLSRVQYESGQYALILALDGGGAAATTFSHTASDWDAVDVTADREEWSWNAIDALIGEVTLSDHPGGERDSDAWVDAFRLRVTFTTVDDPGDDDTSESDDDDAGDDDTTVGPGDDDSTDGPPFGDHDPAWDGCACAAQGRHPGATVGLLMGLGLLARHRRGRPAPRPGWRRR